jgi:preflagellin peptidase FlaK
MELIEVIELASIVVTLFFFSISSIYDLKTREVDDWVWLIYGPIGLSLTILRLLLDASNLVLTLLAIGVTTGVALALGYFGLFGGADAKAMICLGLTLPLNPTIIHPLLGYVHPFFPIVVVIIAFLCSASLSVWFGLKNLVTYLRFGRRMFDGLENETAWRKIMACILGYPAKFSKLRSTFYLYPMEEAKRDNSVTHRSLKLYISAETDREQLVSELSNAMKPEFNGEVWVTPGIPMLLFMLVGLILALIFGDIVFSAVLILARR